MVAKALAEILEEFNDIEDRTERFDLQIGRAHV